MLGLVFKPWESTGCVIRAVVLVESVVEESFWGLLWCCDPEVKGEGGVGRSDLGERSFRSCSSIPEMGKLPEPGGAGASPN